MKKLLLSLIVFLCLIGCNETPEKNKTLSFDNFEINVPQGWKKDVVQGIDFAGQVIYTNSNDTIHIDQGKLKNKFDDVVKVFSIEQIKKYDSLDLDTSNLVWSKTPHIDEGQGTFLKEYYFYKNVNGNKAKFRIPKNLGDGILGVGFDLNNDGNKLFIYAHNLSTEVSAKFIESLNTIKIK